MLFAGVAYEVIPVGDCVKVGPVHGAVSGGFNAALTL